VIIAGASQAVQLRREKNLRQLLWCLGSAPNDFSVAHAFMSGNKERLVSEGVFGRVAKRRQRVSKPARVDYQ